MKEIAVDEMKRKINIFMTPDGGEMEFSYSGDSAYLKNECYGVFMWCKKKIDKKMLEESFAVIKHLVFSACNLKIRHQHHIYEYIFNTSRKLLEDIITKGGVEDEQSINSWLEKMIKFSTCSVSRPHLVRLYYMLGKGEETRKQKLMFLKNLELTNVEVSEGIIYLMKKLKFPREEIIEEIKSLVEVPEMAVLYVNEIIKSNDYELARRILNSTMNVHVRDSNPKLYREAEELMVYIYEEEKDYIGLEKFRNVCRARLREKKDEFCREMESAPNLATLKKYIDWVEPVYPRIVAEEYERIIMNMLSASIFGDTTSRKCMMCLKGIMDLPDGRRRAEKIIEEMEMHHSGKISLMKRVLAFKALYKMEEKNELLR